ncbi:FabD/lysophospholipase-like protein, partial [Atractiella rhizophila]
MALFPALKKPNEKGLRILSMENGGTHGFSTLYTVEAIMKQVAVILGVHDHQELRPCEFFDLICGTSTGGWIALMLGRLGMTVRQCNDAYLDIAAQVFSERARMPPSNKNSDIPHYHFSGTEFDQAFINLIENHISLTANQGRMEPMRDPDPLFQQRCRTFVMGTDEANAVACEIRTYDSVLKTQSAATCTILQAARATCATPNLLPPLTFDNNDGVYNPLVIALTESRRIWGQQSEIACLISLGTGLSPTVTIGQTLEQLDRTVNEIVVDCSKIANEVKESVQERSSEESMEKDRYMETMSHQGVDLAKTLTQPHYKRAAFRRQLRSPTSFTKDTMARSLSEVAEGIIRTGYSHVGCGRNDEALKAFQEAKKICAEASLRDREAYCVRGMGEINLQCERFDEALMGFKEAGEIFLELGLHEEWADCVTGVGDVQFQSGRYDAALEAFHEAKDIFVQVGSRDRAARCLKDVGNVHIQCGRYDDALKGFEEAKEVYLGVALLNEVADCIDCLGEVHLRCERYEEALKAFEESRQICIELGLRDRVANNMKISGEIDLQCSKYDNALKAFRDAKEIYLELGLREAVADCLKNIGEVDHRCSRHVNAILAFKEAKEIYVEVGFRLGVADCVKGVGDVEFRCG